MHKAIKHLKAALRIIKGDLFDEYEEPYLDPERELEFAEAPFQTEEPPEQIRDTSLPIVEIVEREMEVVRPAIKEILESILLGEAGNVKWKYKRYLSQPDILADMLVEEFEEIGEKELLKDLKESIRTQLGGYSLRHPNAQERALIENHIRPAVIEEAYNILEPLL
jgi:hypothetical protein